MIFSVSNVEILSCFFSTGSKFRRLSSFDKNSSKVRLICSMPNCLEYIFFTLTSFRGNTVYWPAPGFTDTELGVLMEPEVDSWRGGSLRESSSLRLCG